MQRMSRNRVPDLVRQTTMGKRFVTMPSVMNYRHGSARELSVLIGLKRLKIWISGDPAGWEEVTLWVMSRPTMQCGRLMVHRG